MPSTTAETIGFVAAAISTLCWFPQSIRTVRTRDTSGISLASQGAYTGAIVLWAVYGVMIASWPLILSNIVQLIPLTAVLWIKLANTLKARSPTAAGPGQVAARPGAVESLGRKALLEDDEPMESP